MIRYIGVLIWLVRSVNWHFQKRRKTKAPELPPAIKEKMKKAFDDVYKAVLACEDIDGHKHCEPFRELPDKRVRRLSCP